MDKVVKEGFIKNYEAKAIGDNIQVGWRQPRNIKNTVCGLKKGEPKKQNQTLIQGVSNAENARFPAQF